MSEQGNYNVLVEVKKTTIWLRKKDAEKSIDGRIKNQGVIMIENKIILIEDDKEIRGMINDYLSGEFEVTAFNDGMSAIQKITSYDEYALAHRLKPLENLNFRGVIVVVFIHRRGLQDLIFCHLGSPFVIRQEEPGRSPFRPVSPCLEHYFDGKAAYIAAVVFFF